MPVVIVKPKAKTIDKLMSAQIVTPDVVDEYAEKKAKLEKKTAKLAPLAKEVVALEKGILGAVDEVVDAGTPVELQGFNNELKIGAQGQRTTLTDVEGVMDMLGEETFLKLVSISAKDLKAYLTPEQVEKVTTTKYAIKRRMKVEAL